MSTNPRGGLRLLIAIALLLGLPAASAWGAATITIVNLDDPGEGFNDPTPAAPVGGNPGTTIGAQRLYVFNYAANIWASTLTSSVEILVGAQFDPQTCDMSSAVLGSASAGSSHRNFTNAPFPNTWYQQALANKLAGVDLNPGVNDINITFNSNLGQMGCFASWYYGVDGNEPPSSTVVELLPVVLHELGHGLGFATITLAGVQMGVPPGPHVYDRHLYDLTQGMHWHEMASDAQRGASANNCQNLVWDGLCVNTSVAARLGPKPVLRVNAPATIAGDYEVGLPQFGPGLGEPGVTGAVELVLDAMGIPGNGCEPPFINAAAIAGKIALIDRGGCPFVTKVKNAQDAGAIGVVIADSMPGCPAAGMSGVDPTIVIPSVRITNDDGVTIKTQLGLGVNASLRIDSSLDAGTKQSKALVYTPIPFAPGSSVSHWDTSAEPNLLMEPFATRSLSADVDLTLQAYQDIGWFGTPGPCGATATVLAQFTAEGREDGILLRWAFGIGSSAAEVAIERAEGQAGPWTSIDAQLGSDGMVFTALDRGAEAGRTYYYRLRVTDSSGAIETLGFVSGQRGVLAAGLFLAPPVPNPTRRGASFSFRIDRPEYVQLAVVDASGRKIATLHQGMLAAGDHVRNWDGSSRSGLVAPGVYFLTLRTSEGVRTQRVSVTR
jgi:hypothetical protein